MIYISSSCIKFDNIFDTLDFLIKKGIKNIELSGGSSPVVDLEKKIVDYVNKKKINVRLHNYFPPPKENFVINLASLNKEIYEKSINHCLKAIELSKELGSNKYSVHAGFLLDPGINEIGLKKNLKKKSLYNFDLSEKKFIKSIKLLQEYAGKKFKIYIENNVLSSANFAKYKNNPFFLTTLESYKNLKKKINFNLLLDVGHLKVSCTSLKKNYKAELENLFLLSDYIHLSSNNGLEDSNKNIISDNYLIRFLKEKKTQGKTFTLEVYSTIEKILNDYNVLIKILKL